MWLNTPFAGPDIALNGIGGIISRIWTIPPTLFATTRKHLFNKNIDILLIKGEVVMVLPLFFPLILLSLFYYSSPLTQIDAFTFINSHRISVFI